MMDARVQGTMTCRAECGIVKLKEAVTGFMYDLFVCVYR